MAAWEVSGASIGATIAMRSQDSRKPDHHDIRVRILPEPPPRKPISGAMTLASPLPLRRETLRTPIGTVVILTDGDGRLRAVDFDDYADRMTRLLDRHYGRGGWAVADAVCPTTASDVLAGYFQGDLASIDALATETAGSPFQRMIWDTLRQVPAGATVSYGALAARIGQPRASRAVGLANGANPIAIVVPCHRIIGRGGALTGYGGGLERKRWLLDHERRHVEKARPA